MRGFRLWRALGIALALMGGMTGCYYDPYTGGYYAYPPYPYGYPYPYRPPPTRTGRHLRRQTRARQSSPHPRRRSSRRRCRRRRNRPAVRRIVTPSGAASRKQQGVEAATERRTGNHLSGSLRRRGQKRRLGDHYAEFGKGVDGRDKPGHDAKSLNVL